MYHLLSETMLVAEDFRSQKDQVVRPAPDEQQPLESCFEPQDRECHGLSVLVLDLGPGEPETWADQAEGP